MADTAAKLPIKAGDEVLVLNGPTDAAALVGPLPHGATLRTSGAGRRPDVVAVFAADAAAFDRAIPTLQEHAHTARAVDATWSALRLRPVDGVGAKLSRDPGLTTRRR